MQESSRTVIFGEAPEESDSEEIELSDDAKTSSTSNNSGRQIDVNDKPELIEGESGQNNHTKSKKGIFGSSLFASISGPQSTFAKLVKYSPYDLLSSSIGQPNLMTTVSKHDRPSTQTVDSATTSVFNVDANQLGKQALQQLSLLHRTLYSKNHQFRASINHLHRQPLQVATKGVHSMSQQLVNDQKIIQEINNAMVKIEREQKNLDIGISMIV